MAVDFGDHTSGFRYTEVATFINSEILMNGGGSDFYMALRSRPWNEIEDQRYAILVDPHVPHTVKRAYAWSALALGVRIAERQHQQQAHMIGLPQNPVGQSLSAPRFSVSDLWQLSQQRDEAVTQLASTQAALQQAVRECDLLRQRLIHVERLAQMGPSVYDTVPGLQAQHFGAAVVPLNGDHLRGMGAMDWYSRQYLGVQIPGVPGLPYVPGNPSFYMPEIPSPWPLVVQPFPLPYQFPSCPPFLMGYPSSLPLSPPVFMQNQDRLVVPVPMLPEAMYPPGYFAEAYSQDTAPPWYQKYYMAAQGPPVMQQPVPMNRQEDVRRQGMDSLGGSEYCTQQQGRQGTQEVVNPEDTGNDSEGGRGGGGGQGRGRGGVGEGRGGGEEEEKEELEEVEEEEVEEEKEVEEELEYVEEENHHRQNPQRMNLPEEGELQGRDETSSRASVSFRYNRSRRKEGSVEKAQARPRWQSWSQAVRESRERRKQPQTQESSQSQPASFSTRMNWMCPRCKAMNLSWRKFCCKCKKICIPVQSGSSDPGHTY